MADFQKQKVQWFPGHMAKTRRQIKEMLPLVDGVVELLDARVPYSSANPELDTLVRGKPRIVLLNAMWQTRRPPSAGLLPLRHRAKLPWLWIAAAARDCPPFCPRCSRC